jgi:hypothetical protein
MVALMLSGRSALTGASSFQRAITELLAMCTPIGCEAFEPL